MNKIQDLFFGTLTTLYVAWDPNKDPPIPVVPDGDHYQLSAPALQELLAYCMEQIRAPVALYRSLEHLLRRADLLKPGLLGPSPSAKSFLRLSWKLRWP